MKDNSALTAGTHISVWMKTTEPVTFEKLFENIKTDVVIVGGGIAGLSVAYALLKSGKQIVVVEDGNIGSGESGRTSAHLVTALDDRYSELEKLFGKEGAKLAAASHAAAIDFIENVCKDNSIDCEFERVKGYLFLHPTDKENSLKKELDAAKRAGLKVKMLDKIPGLKNNKHSCIEFDDQAQFHPMKYLKGLSDAIIKLGGKIFTNTHAKEILNDGIITDEDFKVSAEQIVVSTNAPVNSKFILPLKQFAFRTYVIAVTIKKNILPKALWWDTGDFEMDDEIPPYHYLRTEKHNDEHDLLLIGGEDHATGLADAQKLPEEDRYKKLEEWARDKFDFSEVVYKWSGQVMEPIDGLAYIGLNPMDKTNIYIVTGDSGNGLTHGSLAGILIADLINGKENFWKKIYSPSRINIKSAKAWIKEFGGGYIDYHYCPTKTQRFFIEHWC